MLLGTYVALYSKIIFEERKNFGETQCGSSGKTKHYLSSVSGDILKNILVHIFMVCFS
jgi:hypothetical protein